MKNRQGSALVMVLMIFLIVSIITLSVITVFSQNTKQISYQNNKMKAYYLAKSGVDMGYAAIRQPKSDTNPITIENGLEDNETINLEKNIEIKDFDEESGKLIGIIEKIKITRKLENGEPWIYIYAEALDINTGTIAKANMKYPIDNPTLVIWDE